MEKFDYNVLNNNAFIFTIGRIPQTSFRVVQANVPTIQVPPPEGGTPGATQYFPGTFTEYDELTITFIVDENLSNYKEMYHWITQHRFAIGDGYVPTSDLDTGLISDGFLVTLTNASNPNVTFHFKSMFPIELGSLNFDTTVSEPVPVTCQATFKFSYFTIE